MNFRTTLLAAGMSLAAMGTAFAVPIAAGSSISIDGGVAAIGAASLDLATGLDFLNNGAMGSSDGTIKVSANATGSLSAFTAGACGATCGTIRDIATFSPFSAKTPFFTITEGANTVSFDLNTLTDIIRTAGTAGKLAQLSVSGTGNFRLAGFDDTAGIFTLTAQGGVITTFSGTTVASATAIPEPASMALLGAGLVGLGLARRRKSA